MAKFDWAFSIDQRVRPRKEWHGDGNKIPTGAVVAREPWGRHGCYKTEGSPTFWSVHCLKG
jgi:hypothetical protein